MQYLGASSDRFRAIAGPDPSADRPEAIEAMRFATKAAGLRAVHGHSPQMGTRYAFEFAAETPEHARQFVTTLFSSVYGSSWWAEISPLPPPGDSTAPIDAAAWS
jgi:hypothetical protein